MVWPAIIWGGSLAVSAIAAAFAVDDYKTAKVTEQTETTERARIEDRRQRSLQTQSEEKLASLTSSPWDDLILLLRRIAFPAILVLAGVWLIVKASGGKK